MKISPLLFLIAITWFFMSCAHTQKVSGQAGNYTQGLEAQSLSASKSTGCTNEWQKMAWQKQLSWASSCLKNKNFSELQKWAVGSVEKNPDSPWPAYYLSLAAYEEKKMNRSLWFIEKSLEKVPDEGLFLYQKAKVLEKMGFSTEAQIAFQRAIDERPKISALVSQ